MAPLETEGAIGEGGGEWPKSLTGEEDERKCELPLTARLVLFETPKLYNSKIENWVLLDGLGLFIGVLKKFRWISVREPGRRRFIARRDQK